MQIGANVIDIRFEYPSAGSLYGKDEYSSSRECAVIVEDAALEPSKAALIITGDFDSSVRDRLPSELKDHWTSSRGAGDVGAKVMAVGDEVHVLMHEYYFEPQTDPDFDYERRNKMITRLARHESRHVTMEQAGEAGGPVIDRDGEARRRFLHVADAVISEYRAELDVPLKYDMPFTRFDPIDVAAWARGELTQLVRVDHLRQIEPKRLAYSVAQVLEIGAKQLAPIAAERKLQGTVAGAPFASSTAASGDWLAIVSPSWTEFESVLQDVPPSRERIAPDELAGLTIRLADVLEYWLQQLGFAWSDIDGTFLVKARDLYV
ncbi:hypothetical protein AB0230_08755 [Microbacterium sp. NPDC089190]|uniref:hypothetical protein n=1 Tax=Microbacterium sp. NPDC089190 TaxID=3155063 RepID=UPI00344E1745